ncbi:hypothetical protein ABZP36_022970 [Zizania latifolia]
MRAFDHITFPFAAKACFSAAMGAPPRSLRRRHVPSAAVFGAVRNRTVVSWNAVITGCVKNGCAEARRALEVFGEMVSPGGGIGRATVVSVLPACVQTKDFITGRALHRLIEERGLGDYVAVKNALIDMYGKYRSLEDARVFDHRKYDKDVVSWTAMIGAYLQSGHSFEAFALGCEMPMTGAAWPNYNGTTLVDTYVMCGNTKLMILTLEKGSRRAETWNAAMSGYTLSGREKKSIELFKPSSYIAPGLIDVYAKAGDLSAAWGLFHLLPDKDVDARATVIAGYGMHGHARTSMLLLIQGMPFELSTSLWAARLLCWVGCLCSTQECRVRGGCSETFVRAEPENSGNYVLLGNISAGAGRRRDVQDVRRMAVYGFQQRTWI